MEDITQINNAFEQELIDNGYKPFKSNLNSSIRGFQKRFDNEIGKKYFITIWHYNHAKQLNRPDLLKQDSYTSDVQFRFDKDGKDSTCNIEYWGDMLPNDYRPVTTLKDIESFFEDFFNKFKPEYYESWS